MKLSKLKSIFSIEDNYLEAATGGVPMKKTLLKNFAIFTGKQVCWRLFFRPAAVLKRDSNTSVFLCILRIFKFSEKHLRTADSDYSFTLVIYLFFGCLFKKNYDLLIFYSEENVY